VITGTRKPKESHATSNKQKIQRQMLMQATDNKIGLALRLLIHDVRPETKAR